MLSSKMPKYVDRVPKYVDRVPKSVNRMPKYVNRMPKYVRRHVRKSGPERRQEILDATLRIISEHGVEEATVARIAEAVGITPGALYRHFDSRQALITEANKLANDRALSWVESSTAPDVLCQLEEIAIAHAAWARENFNTVVRPFFLELASPPTGDSASGAPRLNLADFKSFKAVVEIAQEGHRQGVIRAEVAPEEVAWALHMFAWAQDIALLAGAEEAVHDGTIRRNLQRLLETFRADKPAEPGPEGAPPSGS